MLTYLAISDFETQTRRPEKKKLYSYSLKVKQKLSKKRHSNGKLSYLSEKYFDKFLHKEGPLKKSKFSFIGMTIQTPAPSPCRVV